jgi:hypothetical protein
LALAVPLSRFTPRVGGGSAFFVRPLRPHTIFMLHFQSVYVSADIVRHVRLLVGGEAILPEIVQIARRHVLHWFVLVFSEGHRVGISQCFHILFVEPWPNKTPEPTAVGVLSSAIAVHVASRRWLSFFR